MLTLEGVKIGDVWYECPVPRAENGQVRMSFNDGRDRVQCFRGRLPTIKEYLSIFILHAEKTDKDVDRLVNDIEESPLEWANNALLREERMLYLIDNPRTTEGDKVIIPPILYTAPRVTLREDKTVLTVAELGDIAKSLFDRQLSEVPEILRQTIVTLPRSGRAGLLRVGRTRMGYYIASTRPGVHGVARGINYEKIA